MTPIHSLCILIALRLTLTGNNNCVLVLLPLETPVTSTIEDNTSPFAPASLINPTTLPITAPEEGDDDGIYSDDGDDESDDMSCLSNLDNLLNQKMQTTVAAPAIPLGSGGVWVVQGNTDPGESQEESSSKTGAGGRVEDDGLRAQKDQDTKQLHPDPLLILKEVSSSQQSPSAEPATQAASSIHGVPIWPPPPAGLNSSPSYRSPPANTTSSPPTSSKSPSENPATVPGPSIISRRPSTAPSSRSYSKKQTGLLLNVSEDQTLTEPEMLDPDSFALQLLAHDLRILPAYQAREMASADRLNRRRMTADQPAVSGSGAHAGHNLEYRQVSAKKNMRPQSAVLPRRSSAYPPSEAIQSWGAQRQQQQQQPPSASRRSSVDRVGGEEALQVCRAIRGSPGSRDRMTSLPSYPPTSPSGRPRPASAMPSSSVYAKGDGSRSVLDPQPPGNEPAAFRYSGNAASPRRRPFSAQPAYGLKPSSPDFRAGRPSSPPAPASRPVTAAVDVSGKSVSVYIADTVKRIGEANRCLAALGSTRRYQLKDPNSNMVVLLVNERCSDAPPPVDTDPDVSSQYEWASSSVSEAPAVVKSMPLRRFLTTLARLKSQAAARQRQEAGQPRPLPPQYDHLHLRNSPLCEYDDMLEARSELSGVETGGIRSTGDEVEEQLISATQLCEELALKVHFLRHAEF